MKTFCVLSFRYILDCSPSTMLFSNMRNEDDEDDDVLYIQEFAGFRYTYPAASVVEIRYFSITFN
jgi:hypothetical protein